MNRRLNEEGGCKGLNVTNIDPRVDEALLTQVFSTAGKVVSCRLLVDPTKSQLTPTNSAIVEFADHISAETALSTLNTRQIYDFPIKLQWSLQTNGMTPAGKHLNLTFHDFHSKKVALKKIQAPTFIFGSETFQWILTIERCGMRLYLLDLYLTQE